MQARLDPFSFLIVSIAGWMNQHQHRVIEYLIEENRVFREQMGNRRLRFSDDQLSCAKTKSGIVFTEFAVTGIPGPRLM